MHYHHSKQTRVFYPPAIEAEERSQPLAPKKAQRDHNYVALLDTITAFVSTIDTHHPGTLQAFWDDDTCTIVIDATPLPRLRLRSKLCSFPQWREHPQLRYVQRVLDVTLDLLSVTLADTGYPLSCTQGAITYEVASLVGGKLFINSTNKDSVHEIAAILQKTLIGYQRHAATPQSVTIEA